MSFFDRRRDSRHPGRNVAPGWRVRLRTGADAVVVNMSRHGLLLESRSRLLPGHRCSLRWGGANAKGVISGSILRSAVTRLDPLEGVTYQGALRLDETWDEDWAATTQDVK